VLVVDAAPPMRRPSRLGLGIGVAAAACVLVGAVVIAGLRNGSTGRPAAATTPTATNSDPRAAIGTTYAESTCPDSDRGACFDPFPRGRYTFHKSYPQVTLTVGSGWTNDDAWPGWTELSRADTPGATLQVLTNANAVALADTCDLTAAAGVPHDASSLAATLAASPDLVTTKPVHARIGELSGYALDVAPRAGARTVSCPDGTGGVPVLMAPETVGHGADSWALILAPEERARIVLADTSVGRTIAQVAVTAGTRGDLSTWLRVARPVIDSITFAPCAKGLSFSQDCEPVRLQSGSP
jgi:hypothetical protein